MTLISVINIQPATSTGSSRSSSIIMQEPDEIGGHLHHHLRLNNNNNNHLHHHELNPSRLVALDQPDRFSLNSNLSDSSPVSSLISPQCDSSYENDSHQLHNNNNNHHHHHHLHNHHRLHHHHHHHHDHHLHLHHHDRRDSSPTNGFNSSKQQVLARPKAAAIIEATATTITPNNNNNNSKTATCVVATAATTNTTTASKQNKDTDSNSSGSPACDKHLDIVAVPRPRRPSRIEHRQSLSDLGYGKAESYVRLQRLGKGTYATVYLGRSRLSNNLVALKEILKEHDEGAPCTAIREVSLLRLLRHNNIVTLHDICHTPKKLTLVFEYVGPDLYAYMKDNNHLLSVNNIRVLHRDLKPQNLLINSRGELKICDFGLARAKSIPTKSYSNEVVTLWYRPPDVLLGNTDYDHSIDMWGVGCIFYELASGITFFPGSSVRQQLYMIFSSLGAPNKHNWPEILDNPDYQHYQFPHFRPEKISHRVPRLDSDGLALLLKFLRYRPSERISAELAKREPFFAPLPDKIHSLNERESIFDLPGVYMTTNPGLRLGQHQHHNHNL